MASGKPRVKLVIESDVGGKWSESDVAQSLRLIKCLRENWNLSSRLSRSVAEPINTPLVHISDPTEPRSPNLIGWKEMRTHQKRKRSAPLRLAKRRRVIRRRRFRRRSHNSSYSSRQLNARSGFAFRGKLVPKRIYRRMLWRDTMGDQHFRSIKSVDFPALLTTVNNVSQINMAITSALDEALANAFWKTAGGLQDPGFGRVPAWSFVPGAGVPEPLNIVIRGGRFWITMANPSTTDTINVRVQLCYAKQQLRNAGDTAISTTLQDYLAAVTAGNPRPISWSAQAAPDYQEYMYEPVMDKTFDLRPGDDIMFMQRLRPKKVDATQFERGSGTLFPFWFVYAGQRVDTTPGAQAVNITIGHNLSFCVTSTTAS